MIPLEKLAESGFFWPDLATRPPQPLLPAAGKSKMLGNQW
jgi:hypothetical protein